MKTTKHLSQPFIAAILAMGLVMAFGYQLATAQVMTRFNPENDGFQFANSFKNDFIPPFNIKTEGLCGGMAYAALDYYFAHKRIPTQSYRPANGTRLHRYIYNRQVKSIESNIDQWGQLQYNPLGQRNKNLFDRGLDGREGKRLAILKSCLNRGIPVVIDLKGAHGTAGHQVVAIGYDMGRYRGDLGSYKGDLKI